MKAFVETKNMSPDEKNRLGLLLQHPTEGTTLVYTRVGWIPMEVCQDTLDHLITERESGFRKNRESA